MRIWNESHICFYFLGCAPDSRDLLAELALLMSESNLYQEPLFFGLSSWLMRTTSTPFSVTHFTDFFFFFPQTCGSPATRFFGPGSRWTAQNNLSWSEWKINWIQVNKTTFFLPRWDGVAFTANERWNLNLNQAKRLLFYRELWSEDPWSVQCWVSHLRRDLR